MHMNPALDSRRDRMAASPAFLRGGFRPFFLGGAFWALLVIALFAAMLSGAIQPPTALDPITWHRHEMLFGYLGAVIAGFLLTAIPNWTGRLPIAGGPLLLLAGWWLAARIAILCSAKTGLAAAAVVDVGFFLFLAALGAREVMAAKNRNVPIVGLVLLFGLACALDHAEALGFGVPAGTGYRLAIALIVTMLGLIGGRIIPSFTRNWLAKRGITANLPGQPTRFDLGVLAITAVALLAWTFAPGAKATAILLLVAAAGQLVRLARWRGYRTFADPLVLVLHVAYAWIPAGLALLGIAILTEAVPATTALHALTAGAMGGMTLAVMTRATLGHTGRALAAGRLTVLAYLLVTLAALVRVAAPLLPVDYMHAIHCASAAWIGAFLLFLIVYGPMLLARRIDGKTY